MAYYCKIAGEGGRGEVVKLIVFLRRVCIILYPVRVGVGDIRLRKGSNIPSGN